MFSHHESKRISFAQRCELATQTTSSSRPTATCSKKVKSRGRWKIYLLLWKGNHGGWGRKKKKRKEKTRTKGRGWCSVRHCFSPDLIKGGKVSDEGVSVVGTLNNVMWTVLPYYSCIHQISLYVTYGSRKLTKHLILTVFAINSLVLIVGKDPSMEAWRTYEIICWVVEKVHVVFRVK